MTALYRFTVTRRSIVEERYVVEADSEEEAVEKANNGELDYDNDMVDQDFVDWYDDQWEVDSKEDLCPLVKMIKAHSPETDTI